MWADDAFTGAKSLVTFHCRTVGERLANMVPPNHRPKPRINKDGSVSLRWQFGTQHTHFTLWVREREVSWESRMDGRQVSQGRFVPDYLDRRYESHMRRAQSALSLILRI